MSSLISWDPALLPFRAHREVEAGSGWGGGGAAERLAALASLLPHPRFAHGGSLATMMDETFSKTAYLAGEGLFTVSLNIRFKK